MHILYAYTLMKCYELNIHYIVVPKSAETFPPLFYANFVHMQCKQSDCIKCNKTRAILTLPKRDFAELSTTSFDSLSQ